MLRIQPTQLNACEEVARADFVNRVKIHLKTYFPEECNRMGESDLVALITAGISKAADYGIEAEDGVAKFVTLMVAFGTDFDTDPKQLWARNVLDDNELVDPILKADSLYDAALEQTRIDEGITEEVEE